MNGVTGSGVVVLGTATAVGGVLLAWCCGPVSTSFREGRERLGLTNAESQTPVLTFVVGVGFFAGGAFLAVGTLLGRIRERLSARPQRAGPTVRPWPSEPSASSSCPSRR